MLFIYISGTDSNIDFVKSKTEKEKINGTFRWIKMICRFLGYEMIGLMLNFNRCKIELMNRTFTWIDKIHQFTLIWFYTFACVFAPIIQRVKKEASILKKNPSRTREAVFWTFAHTYTQFVITIHKIVDSIAINYCKLLLSSTSVNINCLFRQKVGGRSHSLSHSLFHFYSTLLFKYIFHINCKVPMSVSVNVYHVNWEICISIIVSIL